MGSLTDRKGYLRLYGQEAITSLNRQSLVARRLDAFSAVATVKMEFAPTDFQQMAGLTVFYDTFNFFYLYLSAAEDGTGSRELRMLARDNLRFYEPIRGGVSVGDATTLWLRVQVDGLSLSFSYSLDGEGFTPIGGVLDGSDLSDEAYFDIGHEGHTGTFIGMACQDLSGRRLHADFESFTYTRGE
jgi:xylan 1,4-beta-xylosidase